MSERQVSVSRELIIAKGIESETALFASYRLITSSPLVRSLSPSLFSDTAILHSIVSSWLPINLFISSNFKLVNFCFWRKLKFHEKIKSVRMGKSSHSEVFALRTDKFHPRIHTWTSKQSIFLRKKKSNLFPDGVVTVKVHFALSRWKIHGNFNEGLEAI